MKEFISETISDNIFSGLIYKRDNPHPTTNHQPPTASHQRPVTSHQPPAASDQRSGASHQPSGTRSRPFIIPIFLPHTGCSHQCVFCNQVSITGTRQTTVTADQLRSQIREFLKYKRNHRRPVQIAFFGGSFLGLKIENVKSLLRLATEFVNQGHVDSIRFSTRPDTIDAERLDVLGDYPVSTVELGVQSMDDRVLALARRGHSASDTVRAVERLKARRFRIGLQMMVGLPGDDQTRSLTSARRIADLRPDFVRIYPTVVVENSRLAKWYQSGAYTPLALEASVALVKKIYLLFKKENIAVIRMGLQACKDFEDGSTILAGPFHPAFGHLVYSEIFFDAAKAAIESVKALADTVTLSVNPRSISKIRGLNNSNIKRLKRRFDLKSIKIIPDSSLAEDALVVR